MKKIYAALLLAFVLSYVQTYGQNASPNLGAIVLQPTAAYVKASDGNRRVLRLVFKEGKLFNGATGTVSFNGQTEKVTVPADKAGLESFEIALPGAAVKINTQAKVEVKADGQTYTATCIVSPARADWTVYVLPHSHVDIGYTNIQAKVLKLHMDNIDQSIDLAEKTQNYPEAARFKWTTEAIWVVDNYLRLSSRRRKHVLECCKKRLD
jgi:alpha-mannosidase